MSFASSPKRTFETPSTSSADWTRNSSSTQSKYLTCAALLHDTIEDTATTVEELVEAFGGSVASLVQEVTDDKRLPKAERKVRQVEHAAHLSPKASVVKLADKIANLRDVADHPPVTWSLSRRQEYFDWAKQVVDNIAEPPADLLSLFLATYDRRP
jgi:guanosine-3',5'-bis(diphosphate) 3'-pyrophosphohydrolase